MAWSNSRADVVRSFQDPDLFSSAPLYRTLSAFATAAAPVLELASRGRPGQHPALLFFGAVHHVLRSGVDHELAEFYPSLVQRPRPAEDAGPALLAFCEEQHDALLSLITSRLMQTSHVQRSLALRYALWSLGPEAAGAVHLVEVGASVGLNLRFDRYGYHVGGRTFGDQNSPVQIRADWRSPDQPPDLDALPVVASRTGVDLDPIDARDVHSINWLESLVWPENPEQLELLGRALAVVAADPPPIRSGDIADVAPGLADELPVGEPRLVFHCATRGHVPQERRPAFDAAIESLGRTGPMYRLALEEGYEPENRRRQGQPPGMALTMTFPDGRMRVLAVCAGHLQWIEPLDQSVSPDRTRTTSGSPAGTGC